MYLGITIYKLLIIFVVLVLFFRPKDLHRILYGAGRLWFKASKFLQSFKDEIETAAKLEHSDSYVSIKKQEHDLLVQDGVSPPKVEPEISPPRPTITKHSRKKKYTSVRNSPSAVTKKGKRSQKRSLNFVNKVNVTKANLKQKPIDN